MSFRKAVILLSIVIMACSLFACDYFEELLGTGKPDLTVTSVEVLTDTTGAITGVRTVLKNIGTKDATGVGYAVVLTPDATVSLTNDTVIYKATVDLAIDEEKQIDIANADSSTYMSDNSISAPADAKYYLGVSIDPGSTITEKVETNNETVGDSKVWYLGGSPMLYVVQGTLSIPTSLSYWDTSTSSVQSVTLDGGATHTVYFFAVPDGTTLPAPGSSIDLASFGSGGTHTLVQFYGTERTIDYKCGIPLSGYYYIVALMDVDDNGQLSMAPATDSPPTEPVGVWPINPNPKGGPYFINITEDQTGADMTMSSGYAPR